MKKLIVVLSVIALVVTSCTSRSSESSKRNKIVRVKGLNYNLITESYKLERTVQLIAVDTLYRLGDTIANNKGIFIIIP